MERYLNLGGNSSVAGFEIGLGAIAVAFNDGSCYLYTNQSAGIANIERMIELAIGGSGLNRFINLYVKKGYASKTR